MSDDIRHEAPVADGCGRYTPVDESDLKVRRRLLIATSAVGGAGLLAAAFPFLDSMEPSARAKAEGGPTEVDISGLRTGELRTVVWRSKPIWLLKRDVHMLQSLQTDTGLLSDPDSNNSEQPANCRNTGRSIEPGLAVIVGVCTHLGCTPTMRNISAAGTGSLGNNWPGGFFCPCHGSKFDFAGRVFKNVPAPVNLVIPPYRFLAPTRLKIGDENA